jgi:phosphomannomutase/phosphoglucomutase
MQYFFFDILLIMWCHGVNRLFGTDGVRGIVNEWFTPERALRLGLAIGSYFGEGAEVVVGRDARAGNEFMVRAVLAGLISSGLRVYDAGLLPTPALQYNIRRRWFEGGVMVTASHNPPEYVGIKVILGDGVEAPREVEAEIERAYWEERFRRVSWTSLGERVKKLDDAIDFYVNGIISQVTCACTGRRETSRTGSWPTPVSSHPKQDCSPRARTRRPSAAAWPQRPP